jgi:DNA repair protein RadA
MLALEIDRLKEIDDSLREQLKKAGFNSIKDIVIRGPVEVAKSAQVPLEEAANICNNAALLPEQQGVIPNTISEVGNNNPTSNKGYIKTGSAELDRLLGGRGIETGAITEFYGHSGSGKTQICLSLCVMVQQLNPDNKAIYIDTEGKFRPERLAEIAQKKEMDVEKSKRNIKIVRVLNSARLETLIQQNCCSEITKDPQVKLLVVDSVTSLYRAEYGDRSMLSQRQHQLLKIMQTLRNIAQVYNVAIVITNQIQNNLGELGYNYDKPVGGNVMARTSAFRISLGGSNPDKMSAKLMTSPCYPQDNIIRFAINDRGITDVTDD